MRKALIFISLTVLVFFTACSSATDDSNFIRGTVSNNVYENSYSGLRFSPGPSWSFEDDESILRKNGIDETGLDENSVNDLLSKNTTVYDMIAEYRQKNVSVIVIFENMDLTFGTKEITEDEYIEKLKTEITENNKDKKLEISEKENCSIGGYPCRCVNARVEMDGASVNQSYYIRKIEDHFMSVCVTATDKTDIDREIISLFEAIE